VSSTDGDDAAVAWFGGRLATGLLDVTSDLSALDGSGFWAVVLGFEGEVVCARFSDVRDADLPTAPWPGVPRGSWTSSMSRDAYLAGAARTCWVSPGCSPWATPRRTPGWCASRPTT